VNRFDVLQTLHEINRTILDRFDLKEMMEAILDKTIEMGGFDIGLIRLLDASGQTLQAVANRGYRDPANVQPDPRRIERHRTGSATARGLMGQAVFLVDLTEAEGMRSWKREGVSSAMMVPLRTEQQMLGLMQLGSRERRNFEAHELHLLDAIGVQTAIAIQKAQLYQQTQAAKMKLELSHRRLKRLSEGQSRLYVRQTGIGLENRELFDEINNAKLELERSNADLEQFAYVASHDLQEPLRMVAGYTQRLAKRYKGKLDEEADEYMDLIVDGAARMQHLVKDLLAYSRVGGREEKHAPIDCGIVLQTALAALGAVIRESGAVVTHDPLPIVTADELQLTQVLQNLIGNGIKFHATPPPAIHVSCRREGARWIFSVKDNGIGIEPQDAERIFVIFQRLHSRQDYPGTGIGLALCKKIVERHGGRIWVESEPGKGSTFYFSLPANPSD
jgi:signal transduction histidine kinase